MKKLSILLNLFVFVFGITNANVVEKVVLIPYPNQIKYSKGNLNLPFDAPVKTKGLNEKSVIDFLTGQVQFPENRTVDIKQEPHITLEIIKHDHLISDETYQLLISKKGVVIKANASKGLLYGISTLNQMFYQTKKEGYYKLPCLSIDDVPAYSYRGFMLDASRHRQSVQMVKSILDLMTSIKLNVFHWHLTDDPGWRIESRKYPRLNKVASYAVIGYDQELNGYYSIDEIHEILEYAGQRNITVIPEVDIPGHSWAIMDTYPEFRCPNMPCSNAFCAGNPNTLSFIKSLYDEIIEIFHPEYLHIGGDEREKGLWDNCPLCKKKMEELNISNEDELQNYFLNEVSEYLRSKNIKTMAWAENLKDGIPKGQITQAWRMEDEAPDAIKMGHRVVVSTHTECYLDYPATEEELKTKPSWMIVLPVEKVYNFDFIPPNVSPEQAKLVLGGEAALWTELIREDQIFHQIKNRIQAHAERSWTKPEIKSFNRFERSYEELQSYFARFFGKTK